MFLEERQRGLGLDFEREVFQTVAKLSCDPMSWPVVDDECRLCCTRRFKYGLIFQVCPDEVVIISVMHLSRDAGYWKDRLSTYE
jgi:hypothetical protein